jgi:hypothetical protein
VLDRRDSGIQERLDFLMISSQRSSTYGLNDRIRPKSERVGPGATMIGSEFQQSASIKTTSCPPDRPVLKNSTPDHIRQKPSPHRERFATTYLVSSDVAEMSQTTVHL